MLRTPTNCCECNLSVSLPCPGIYRMHFASFGSSRLWPSCTLRRRAYIPELLLFAKTSQSSFSISQSRQQSSLTGCHHHLFALFDFLSNLHSIAAKLSQYAPALHFLFLPAATRRVTWSRPVLAGIFPCQPPSCIRQCKTPLPGASLSINIDIISPPTTAHWPLSHSCGAYSWAV